MNFDRELVPLTPDILERAGAVETAHGWLATAKAQRGEAYEAIGTVGRDYARRGADDARAGKPKPPTPKPVIAARAALDEADTILVVMPDVVSVASRDFLDVIEEQAEAAIRAMNRPLERVVTDAREHAQHLGGDVSATAALRSEKSRVAWLALERLVGHYGQLRNAWKMLTDLAELKPDDPGALFFSELKDAGVHQSQRPAARRRSPNGDRNGWPTSPPGPARGCRYRRK